MAWIGRSIGCLDLCFYHESLCLKPLEAFDTNDFDEAIAVIYAKQDCAPGSADGRELAAS